MSRSYKKNAIITDVGVGYKKYVHRATRTKVKQVLTSAIDYEDMLFPLNKGRELVLAYKVCDHIWRYDRMSKPWVYFHYYTGEPELIEYTQADFRMYKNK